MAEDSKDEPWFHKPTLVISIAAFVISVVTTVASGYRTYRQDVEARKTELRALISQFNSGQLQAVELVAKHQNDAYLNPIMLTVNAQNLIMARQAYALAKLMGRDASSLDLTNVAYALQTTGDEALSEEMNLMAIERATTAIEYLGPTRQLAQLKMQARETAVAKIYWEKALNVFDLYPTPNQQYVHFQHAQTHLYWANSSLDCKTLLDRLAAADKELGALGTAVSSPLLQWRSDFAKKADACSTPTAAGAATPETSIVMEPNAEQASPAGRNTSPVGPAQK
jgi:hypothetical protein